ncbi:hypothetical protein [Telluribacter sp.]|jgi:hypothetical protein|uniref:hypothetical protein n=1 Tax=Telluribacter sp. TaxID=1978767 RepID=UPI002E0FE10F|nr:hypothetical protein [Telluribacter sp.]
MKNKVLIIILTAFMAGGYSVESAAATLSADATQTELLDKGNKKKKRKRYRGYKKPKNKKFLGIFKRKSSCDCPKY